MLKKHFRYYLIGSAALLIAVSAVYLSKSSQSEAPLIASVKTEEPAAKPSSQETPAAKESEEDVEDVYVFPQPENYSSNPPREGWEEELIKIVRSDGEDLAKADILLSKIPSLPDEGKIVALEHAAALIPDNAYLRYRSQLFALSTNPEMKEAVMVDVLSRDDNIRFMTMLEIMKTQQGPMKDEVREILSDYLDHDYGTDPNAWEPPLRKFLADNED